MQIDHFFELASGKLFVIIGNDITNGIRVFLKDGLQRNVAIEIIHHYIQCFPLP
jgi:hypothetical protein